MINDIILADITEKAERDFESCDIEDGTTKTEYHNVFFEGCIAIDGDVLEYSAICDVAYKHSRGWYDPGSYNRAPEWESAELEEVEISNANITVCDQYGNELKAA